MARQPQRKLLGVNTVTRGEPTGSRGTGQCGEMGSIHKLCGVGREPRTQAQAAHTPCCALQCYRAFTSAIVPFSIWAVTL